MPLVLNAERYNDDQIRDRYERPPFGEPALLDNQLIVGPAGVGKTHLLRKLAIAADQHMLSLYVDLPAGGVAELSEELPHEKPRVLFPEQADYIAAGSAALSRSILSNAIAAVRWRGLDVEPLRREVSRVLGVKEDWPERAAEETLKLRQSLQSGTAPPPALFGINPPGFAAVCETVATFVLAHYGRRVVFLLDQLDYTPTLLQEEVVDVLRREYTGTYLIATRPCPSAPEELRNISRATPNDFTMFSANHSEASAAENAAFLVRLSSRLRDTGAAEIAALELETAEFVAWASGGSTRTAVNILLETEKVRKRYGGVLTSTVMEAALRSVALSERRTLQSMGRRYIGATKRIFDRWIDMAAQHHETHGSRISAMRVRFTANEFPEPLAELLRICVKENVVQFLAGEHWIPGELPAELEINPIMLSGGGPRLFTSNSGNTFTHEEAVGPLMGYFSPGHARAAKRRSHPSKPVVFVSMKLSGPNRRDVRQSLLFSLLESRSRGRFGVTSGVDIPGGIITEVEQRIRRSALQVNDLTIPRPDVMAEAGLAMGSEIPVVFAVRHIHDKERLPRYLLDYGIQSYVDRPEETMDRVMDLLNQQPGPQGRWQRGLDGFPLRPTLQLRNVLVISPSQPREAEHIRGMINTIARQAGFDIDSFLADPTSQLSIDELIRAVARSSIVLVDLAGIEDFDYAIYAGIASGLAYRWRRRRYANQYLALSPILYVSHPGREDAVPQMLRRLLISSGDVPRGVTRELRRRLDTVNAAHGG